MITTKLINLLAARFKSAAVFLLIFVFVVAALSSVSAQRIPSQDPGHKEDAEVARVKFSVPQDFSIEKSSDVRVAFMRHEKYDLALFVAVPDEQISDEYLIRLSNGVVAQMLPQEKSFKWKMLPDKTSGKVSKHQTTGGNTKGFNKKLFVQTDYIVVKVKDREIIIGYITGLGSERDAERLFNLEGVGGMSMPGWYAQAHILASITGEKYEDINPGTFIRSVPAPGK